MLGLDDRIGSLTPGKRADIVLIRKGPFGDSIVDDACAHVLLQTSPRDIDTVIVDGEVRMRGGMLLGFDAERAASMMRDSRQRILGCLKLASPMLIARWRVGTSARVRKRPARSAGVMSSVTDAHDPSVGV